MTALEPGALAGLVLLGAVHGVNPAMGWLFAVALGLQQRAGRAVWRALPPLALGHAGAVALAVAVLVLAGELLPPTLVRWAVAALLLGFGLQRLLRGHGHGRLAGMRVSWAQLTGWSFLMASAHGAGLMVLPLLLGGSAGGAGAHGGHAWHAAAAGVTPGAGAAGAGVLQAGLTDAQLTGVLAAAVHTTSYLVVTALIALLVYHKLGLRLLRTAWINLDALWAGALMLTAVLTVLL